MEEYGRTKVNDLRPGWTAVCIYGPDDIGTTDRQL